MQTVLNLLEAEPIRLFVSFGAVLFLPWLPSFVFQLQRTGAPWGGPACRCTVA